MADEKRIIGWFYRNGKRIPITEKRASNESEKVKKSLISKRMTTAEKGQDISRVTRNASKWSKPAPMDERKESPFITKGEARKAPSSMDVRKEIKALVSKKGLNKIINADLNEIHERTGASYTQLQNAINYFQYSPQTKKYREK